MLDNLILLLRTNEDTIWVSMSLADQFCISNTLSVLSGTDFKDQF